MTQGIADRYKVEAKIGAGGMGMVYRGVDTQTHQPVAIKNLNKGLTDPDVMERFRREGEALRELDHPNIVKLVDAVEVDGVYSLIMEYVSGGDLTALMNRGKLETKNVLRLAIDLADALTRAHKLNIIHRDLKPANVLITHDGTLKLTDFGVAHFSGRQRVTDVDSLVGTMDYLAPEVLKGDPPDARVDIWAFGIMLYEMVSGSRPFTGDHVGQVVEAILIKQLPDLEKISPNAPVALVDLIYRMLERDPAARIASAQLVGAELEAILQGRTALNRTDTNEATQIVRFESEAPLILSRTSHNLPAQMTPFVGRESELKELDRLLKDTTSRLITILAPGGMGKTRLSLESAERQLRHYEQGVFVVQLAPLTDVSGIVPAIAEATRYPFQQDGRDQKQQLLDYLSGKNMLLIMDNFEHLIDGAGIVTEILQAARQVRIVATSRQRLNQTGETVFSLGAMDFPKWETPADALEFAAVKLFLQSAQRIQPGFELTSGELPYVARICRLAHGMPLGILLAASWLSTLSPAEIADEMKNSLDFLESDLADLPERQRSLRAVFNYSWNLLSEPEQQVFMKLSIFRGGFTREAAQEVAGASLRTLMTLINKSLLHRETETGRYDVHELLRQYAEEKLEQSGDAEATYDRHSRYYMQFTAEREADIKGRAQKTGLLLFEADFDNITAAWNRAISQRDEATLGGMIEGVYWFCTFRSRFQTGADLFQRARAYWQMQPAQTAPQITGRLHMRFPEETNMKALSDWGAQVARRHGARAELAFSLRAHGLQLSHVEINSDGVAFLRESLDIYQALGDSFHTATVLDDLGWAIFLAGGDEERTRIVRQSLAIRESIGDRIGVANSKRNLSTSTWMLNLEDTRRWMIEAHEIGVDMQDRVGTAWTALLLGSQLLWMSKLDEAADYLDEGLRIAEDINLASLKGLAYIMFGWMYGMHGDYANGMAWTDKGLALVQHGDDIDPAIATFVLYAVSVNAVGSGDFERSVKQQGIFKFVFETFGHNYGGLPDIWVANFVITIPFYAGYLVHHGEYTEAVEALSLAFNHPNWIINWDTTWGWLVDLQTRLHQTLGDNAYQAAWERGKNRSYDALVEQMMSIV